MKSQRVINGRLGELNESTGHWFYVCADRECTGCMFCHGGLGWCLVCNAFEGQLLPRCPGVKVAEAEHDRHYDTNLRHLRSMYQPPEAQVLPLETLLGWKTNGRVEAAEWVTVGTACFSEGVVYLHPSEAAVVGTAIANVGPDVREARHAG